MPREKNLSTIIKSERVKVQMVPGRLVLVPRDQATVELRSGGFDKIPVDTVAIEAEGIHRMGMYSRLYDMSDDQDRQTIELLEKKLKEFPHWGTHSDYMVKIVGEFSDTEPFIGYDDLDAAGLEGYWSSMPDRLRADINLESTMKHELSRVDEDGVSITDDAKVKMLDKLYKAQQDVQKVAADETVAL